MQTNFVTKKSEAAGSYIVVNKRTGTVVFVHEKANRARAHARVKNEQEWMCSEEGRKHIEVLKAKKLQATFSLPPQALLYK